MNATKLHSELETAGIPIFGVDSDGRIAFREGVTEAQRIAAAAIVAAHDPIEWTMRYDKQMIFGGDDVATITFTGAANADVAFTVNGVAQTLTLDAAGNGAITLDGDLPRGAVAVVGSGKLAGQSLKLFVV